MKLRASAILIFGVVILAGSSNALAWGHGGGGGFMGGGRFVVQNRPFIDHRFVDRRFFFADRRFFVGRPIFIPRRVFIAPPAVVVTPPPFIIAPVAPIDPFPFD